VAAYTVLLVIGATARGGVLLALAEKLKIPVHAIGVGESVCTGGLNGCFCQNSGFDGTSYCFI